MHLLGELSIWRRFPPAPTDRPPQVSLDRAQEVLKGAKRYLYWLQEPAQASKLNSLGAGAVSVIEDNQRLIRLRSPYRSLNTVTARPKYVCRRPSAFLREPKILCAGTQTAAAETPQR